MANYSFFSDEQLIVLMASGDRAAFEELYARHWSSMFRFAWNILKDAEAATDIVQDIFVWLWTNRETVQISFVSSYLKAAVKFKVANFIRSGKVRESFYEEAKRKNIDHITPSSEEELEIRELQALIAHAVQRLPEKCRAIFLLSREQGFSNREIAEQLNISVKTVENQMTIALKKIRSSLENISDEYSLKISGPLGIFL